MTTLNIPEVTTVEAYETLKTYAQDMWDIPFMLWGSPGIGKTSMIMQLCEEICRNHGITDPKEIRRRLCDIRLTTMNPSDLRGLPSLDQATKRAVWFTPEFLPKPYKTDLNGNAILDENGNTIEETGPGFIFIDELTASDRRMQTTVYSLLQERRIGDWYVPKGWFVIAAGNRPEDGAISYEMGSALADRMNHMCVKASRKASVEHAHSKKWHPVVVSFMEANPDYIDGNQLRMQKDVLLSSSPRGLERVSRAFYNNDRRQNPKALSIFIRGQLGNEIGTAMLSHMETMSENIKISELFALKTSKERAEKMPKSLTGCWGLVHSLIQHCENTENTRKAIMILNEMRNEYPELTKNRIVPFREIATTGMEYLLTYIAGSSIENDILEDPYLNAYMESREKDGHQ